MNISNKEIFIEITKKVILKFYNYKISKKYNRKYSIEYYLNLMFELINNVNNWNTIQKLKIYNPINKFDNTLPKYHWKTIQNLYDKWCNDNIFKIANDNYINNKTIKLNEIDLFIDTSFINNKYGIEDIGMNTDNKKKKATKISILSDDDKFIYSVVHVPINIKIKKRRKKCLKRRKRKYVKKTKLKKIKKPIGFIHDVNTIQFTINNINKKYNYEITLIGDKGYISSKTYKFKKNKINLITIKRKNQKIDEKLIKKMFIKIKKRKIIENTIACLKKNERVMTRKDHKIKNYMSWIYITSLLHNIKINNKYISV